MRFPELGRLPQSMRTPDSCCFFHIIKFEFIQTEKVQKRKPARQNLSKVSLLPGKLTIIFRQALYLLGFHFPHTHKRRSVVLFFSNFVWAFCQTGDTHPKVEGNSSFFLLDKGPEFFFLSQQFSVQSTLKANTITKSHIKL